MRTPAKQSPADSQAFAQLNLVHEDVYDLLKSLVNSLGGPKLVGSRLYPQKDVDAARRYLLDCLNPERDHDLGVEGFLTLLRWAREKGIHFAINWVCDDLGYGNPPPMDPEDQRAELQRQFIACTERMEQLARKLGK